MILADKIIQLRKKNGWSQEELANQMNVSRQSVSKWESAQSVPDLEKILLLGRIFGVSTDYLLKDELETEEYSVEEQQTEGSQIRRVSMEEANEFLNIRKQTARPVALAVVLCILSPVCLLLLGTASEMHLIPLSEDQAGGMSLIVLLVMIAAAVATFISNGMKTKRFEYMEKEAIETEYGVSGMVRERQKQYKDTYTRYCMTGVCCCILSAVPVFACMGLQANDLVSAAGVSMTLVLVSAGVYLFVVSGTYWSGMEQLLQEGDFTKEAKEKKKITGTISGVYWLIATAIYLGCSFATDAWDRSWIIWPVAGVLFAAVMIVCNVLIKPKRS